ncbi:hypothetical protein PC121_g13734 [Phytophthora cactorum]|nr:hypothetical protein PC120_g13004 [Phytophthora cactorum]KAG3059952.1 hypothetical protein PC121_g13734 [Phytophthora cactorum]KAG4052495.1 hypothetical protein PC123_g12318 [Phytophthora cactorum]
MMAIRKFVSEGKIVLRGAVSEEVADDMRPLARHGNFMWISDLISGVIEDDSRVQAVLPDQQARNLSVLLRGFVKTFFPEAEAEGSILVATERHVLVWVRMERQRGVTVENEADHPQQGGYHAMTRRLYLRPDRYQTNRVVLHAYLDTPVFEQPEVRHPRMVIEYDDTVDHDSMFRFVWNCPFKASGDIALRKHLNHYHGIWFNQGRHGAP